MRFKHEDLKRGMKVKVRNYRRRPDRWRHEMMEFCGRTVTISQKFEGCLYIYEDKGTRHGKCMFRPRDFELANVWQGEIRDETL